jgi:signal transduction histidine kinase
VDADEQDALFFRQPLLEDEAGPRETVLAQAKTAADARQLVADRHFDLLVVDSQIGEGDGLKLVRQLRGGGLSTPILMLTGSGGEEAAVEALRAGATDYLDRSHLDDEALRHSVRYALDVARQAELRRRAEEALRLREEQLRESRRMETVATLSGGIAHEFNNLLNVVAGYGDMLRRRLPAGDPLQRHVEHILHAAEKATALTRQLMAFSRNQVLQPSVLDAAALLNELAPVVRSVVGRRVEVAVQAEPGGVGLIKADRSQIDHALMNLVLNAKDAMPEGGTLTLEAGRAEIDSAGAFRDEPSLRLGRYVKLVVSDTGVGMDPDIRSRAFEPFFTTKGRANATGLGLSTVYGIVRQSEGHMRVDSEPGRGTTVAIYLPLVDAAGEPESLEAPRS